MYVVFEYSFLVYKSIFFNILRISLMRNSNTQVIYRTTINLWVKAVFVQRLRPMKKKNMKKAVVRTLTMARLILTEILVVVTL